MDKLKKKRFRGIAIMLTMVMTLFQSVSAYASPTDVVTFADSNIKNAVSVELGIPGGAITQGDMAYVSNLTISSGTISSLSGLEYASKLNSLTIKNCNITTDFATLSTLTKFTSLYLQNDTITSLNGLPLSTSSIDVYDSGLSDISPLTGLINVKNMVIQGNNVSDISAVSSMTKLTYLSFEDNKVTDISPLTGLTTLTHLSLDKNTISDLSPLANLANLTELQLRENNISDINPLSNLPKLVYLNLDNNDIYNPSNKITDITPLANTLSNCSSLYLYLNKIPNYNALENISNNPSYTNTSYNTWEGNLNTATIHGTAWVTVKYVDENNADISTPSNKNINFAEPLNSINVSSPTYTARTINNYISTDSTTSQAVTFDKTDLIKTIVFHYKKISNAPTTTTPGSVTIEYLDEDGNDLATPDTLDNLTLGDYTENAKSFDGYVVTGDSSKTVTLTAIDPDQTIIFNYKKKSTSHHHTSSDPDPIIPPKTPVVTEVKKEDPIILTGSFIVRFVDESDSSLIIPEVDKKNFPLDTYIETALYFDGYQLDDQETKSVTLDKDHLNGVIEFKYTKIKIPEELPKTGDNSKTKTIPIILLLSALSSLFFILKKRA